MRNITALTLAISMIMVTPVLASPTTEIQVSVNPTDINVTLPVGGLAFTIDPNAVAEGEGCLTATGMDIWNESPANVTVRGGHITKKEGTTMDVVYPGNMGDWNKLSKEDSSTKVGLAIMYHTWDKDIWDWSEEHYFDDYAYLLDNRDSFMPIDVTLYGGEESGVFITFSILHGLSIEESIVSEYDMELTIALASDNNPYNRPDNQWLVDNTRIDVSLPEDRYCV